MRNMQLLNFEPQPPTMLEMAWALAPRYGGDIERVRRLNYEEFLLAMATHEHLQVMAALDEQLGALLSNPPLEPDGESQGDQAMKEQEAIREHRQDLEEVQLLLAQESCCWTLPLDHPFGEQLAQKPPRHWLRAPGMKDWRTGERYQA